MCSNPNKIPDIGFVACRECWQCRERKVDDWVGRNIAEYRTATSAHVVTLTYGRDPRVGSVDHLRAAVLTYSDVQKMLKRLRFDGYPVRYFAVGEYGSLKGRAHWHVVLYWQDKVPDMPMRKNTEWQYWWDEETNTPIGWTYWDKVTPQAIRYACKYLLKDARDDAAQAFGPMPSKKPPLGDAYFRQLAEQYVSQGLAPQDLFYSFPEVTRVPNGARANSAKALRASAKPVQFLMRDKTAENFLEHFVKCWREKYHDEPPASPVVWDYLNKKADAYIDSISVPQIVGRADIYPEDIPEGASPVWYDPLLKAYRCEVNGENLYLRRVKGEQVWRKRLKVDFGEMETEEERLVRLQRIAERKRLPSPFSKAQSA